MTPLHEKRSNNRKIIVSCARNQSIKLYNVFYSGYIYVRVIETLISSDISGVYVASTGTNFYRQCVASDTVHLGFCAMSLMWLSRRYVVLRVHFISPLIMHTN